MLGRLTSRVVRSPSKTSPSACPPRPAHRPRPRRQDDRTGDIRRRAAPRLAAEDPSARSVPEGRRRARRHLRRIRDRRDRPRPAARPRRPRRPARAIDPGFRPQPRDADGPADRTLGRALLDRRRHPVADRERRIPREAGQGGRQVGGCLHPAGRARPASASARATSEPFHVNIILQCARRGPCPERHWFS